MTSSPVVVGTWLEEGSFDNMMSSESDGAEVGVERKICYLDELEQGVMQLWCQLN